MRAFTLQPVTAKQDLRRWAKAIPAVTPAESDAVVSGLVEFLREQPVETGLLFLPIPGEVDLSPLPDLLPGIAWHVTRTPQVGQLTVHPLGVDLEEHPFGYRQPVADAPKVDPAIIDLVLVPGLLFDEKGGRLGRGKGYYDDLLGRTKEGCVVAAVTVERRLVAQVPMEGTDHRMQYLATELGCRPVQT